jgi:hypothetical protein
MLSQKDINQIEKIVEDKINEATKYLPTKDEFYNKMDELLGEVKAMREEQTVIGGKTSEHTDVIEEHETRIGKLEEVLQPQN